MTGAAARMREALNATGCYRLTGETSADWEVTACAAGLDWLDQEIEGLLADLFPDTMGEGRLAQWEALFQPMASAAEAEVRRETLSRRLAQNPTHYTLADYTQLLPAAGVAGLVVQEGDGLLVLVSKWLGLPQAEVERELDLLLPAHLTWSWAEPLNWDALDQWAPAYSAFDAKRKTWGILDGMSRAQMESYFQ